MHGWVVLREAHRHRMPGEVLEPHGSRVVDQQPQQAAAFGEMRHARGGFGLHAHVEELGEPVALLVENTQGAVAGVDEFGGRLHDALQRRVDFEARRDREHRVEQSLETVARTDDLTDAVLHLVEQLVEAQAGESTRSPTVVAAVADRRLLR